MFTTIRITKELREYLKTLRITKNESYEEIIMRILNIKKEVTPDGTR